MSMLKIAGNDSNGVARALRTNENGNAQIEHVWKIEEIPVFSSLSIRDTSAHWSPRIDLSGYAIVSMRIKNTLDSSVRLQCAVDIGGSDSTEYLYSATNSNLNLTLETSTNMKLLTPDEYPWLQYLHYLKFRASCDSAPNSGSLTVTVVGRR